MDRLRLRTFLTLLALLLSVTPRAQQAPACTAWQQCRELALDAVAREDYEVFHDLAWRAVQRGPRNSGDLMAMLARAQSLSGRPHDALVMLQRLAALGVVTDAAQSSDFRRVRALPAWPEFQQLADELLASGRAKLLTDDPEQALEAPPDLSPPVTAPAAVAPLEARPPPGTAKAKASEAAPPDSPAASSDASPAPSPVTASRFSSMPFVATGLAHDGVSNRFIIADREERKLAVIGEQSQRITNFAGAESAGFGDITALALDAREGDLWVVSVSPEPPSARLHKLQLISGRLLYGVSLPERFEPARFTDVAVAAGGSVLVLDAAGRRVFRLPQRARELVEAASVDRRGLTSLAPASASVAYVAHHSGIARVDLASGAARDVGTPADLSVHDLLWIRYLRGTLVGIQRRAEGSYRVVRLQLDRAGRRILALTVLDPDVAMSGPPPAVLSGNVLYYLSESPSPDFSGSVETIVRRVSLK